MMDLRTIRQALAGKRVPAVVLSLALSYALPRPAFSAADIRAHVDAATGKIVFVNDDAASGKTSAQPTPKAQPPSKEPARADTNASSTAPDSVKRVLATTGETSQPVDSQYVVSEESLRAQTVLPGDDPEDLAERYDDLIEQIARQHHLDPDLIRAVIRVESNFNPYAVSQRGARGLMQLIPATARRFGVINAFDPRSNLDGGARYLKYLMGLFNGDLRMSLAAYNAGEAAVARRSGIPPYRETQNYLRKIDQLYPLRSLPAGIPPEPTIMKFVDGRGVSHFSNTDQR